MDTFHLLMENVFKLHGFPNKIISDRDIRFTNDFYLEVSKRLRIKLVKSSSNPSPPN